MIVRFNSMSIEKIVWMWEEEKKTGNIKWNEGKTATRVILQTHIWEKRKLTQPKTYLAVSLMQVSFGNIDIKFIVRNVFWQKSCSTNNTYFNVSSYLFPRNRS